MAVTSSMLLLAVALASADASARSCCWARAPEELRRRGARALDASAECAVQPTRSARSRDARAWPLEAVRRRPSKGVVNNRADRYRARRPAADDGRRDDFLRCGASERRQCLSRRRCFVTLHSWRRDILARAHLVTPCGAARGFADASGRAARSAAHRRATAVGGAWPSTSAAAVAAAVAAAAAATSAAAAVDTTARMPTVVRR